MNGDKALRRDPVVRTRVFLLACAALVYGGSAFTLYLVSARTLYAPSGAVHASARTADEHLGVRPNTERMRISYVVESHTHTLDSKTELASPAKFSFNHLSLADGLSHADVRAIAQDRQGFMWFGTWLGGLDRYDGYAFKVYRHDDQDDRSIGGNTIRTIYVDRAGVLWVATNEGIDRYDQDTDSFVHYRHRPDDPAGLLYYRVDSFYEDESGTLWLASFGGLGRFDRTNGRVYPYRPTPNDPASFRDTDLRSLAVDAKTGLLWASAWGEGVSALDRSTGRFTRYKNIPGDPTSLSSNDVVQVFQDREGRLWFATLGGLNRFDPKTRTFIRYVHDPRNPASLSDDSLAKTYEDRAGRFWVATNNGLNLMDRARGTFTRYMHDANDAASLSSNVINPHALYEDASGALWIGTRSTGVERLPGVVERFTTYRHKSEDVNSPSSNTITGLTPGSAGALWIGTDVGLDRFDGRTFTHYLADPNDPRHLSPGPERLVAQDPDGAVWTGTYGGGLDRLDGEHVTHFRHDPRNSDSPANNNIAALVPDTEGGLWIGVHGKGMDHFDGRHFTHFPPPGSPAGPPDAFVRPLLLDRHSMLWSCSDNSGLVRFDTHTREFTTYLMDPSQPGQGANWTTDIYSDGAVLWVGSPNGLFRFDPETGQFTRHYTEKDGLANNSIVGVLGDVLGNMWVSTINGLSRFDPKTETFQNYDMFDGLQGDGFSPRCEAKASDSRLFFGGVNGLSGFYPDKVVDNPTPPPVVLTEFELFNVPVKPGTKNSPLRQAINVASSITLRHDQSVFRFQFAALNYTAPQKNKYAYKLEGFDRDWQYTDATRRFATYTNLDPGGYTFRVKASNNDGVWNERGVELHLTILPAWYRTNLFRVLCVAVVIGLLWLMYHRRMQTIEQRQQLLQRHQTEITALNDRLIEAQEEERTRIAGELHDGVLQQLTSVTLLLGAMKYEIPQESEATSEIEKLQKRLMQVGTDIRQLSHELHPASLQDQGLPDALSVYCGEFSKARGIPVTCETDATAKELSRGAALVLYRIAQEALGNVAKHSQAKHVQVTLTRENGRVRLTVADDGVGFTPDGAGMAGGLGLVSMRERLRQLNGTLALQSEPGRGTTVTAEIPFRPAS